MLDFRLTPFELRDFGRREEDISSDRYLNASAQIRFQTSRKWDVALGYRYFERYIDHDGFDNLTSRDQYVAAIGYRF